MNRITEPLNGASQQKSDQGFIAGLQKKSGPVSRQLKKILIRLNNRHETEKDL